MSALLAGLAMGFLGSAHCIGMCGGIAATLPVLPGGRRSPARLLACHTGRLASYTLMGAAGGAVGATFAGVGGSDALLLLRAVAAMLIVAAGLHVAGWSVGLGRIEATGGRLWRRIAPLARRARSGRSLGSAFVFGCLWGWLPCGFVYTALVVAAAAGSATDGALVMAGFGAGTLPATLAAALLAGRAAALLRGPGARQLAGAMVVSFGLWTLASAAMAWTASPGSEPGCHSAATDAAATRSPLGEPTFPHG